MSASAGTVPAGPSPSADRIALLELRESAIAPGEVVHAVTCPAAGGLVAFYGYVREQDEGRAVQSLEYSAHPGATDRLREVAEGVLAAHPVLRLAAVHRLGRLAVGELAVAVAVGCAHRDTAFAAARQLIDEVKGGVPIWKHQVFGDGTDQWVGVD